MKKILILGASGMLGSMAVRWFSSRENYRLTATTRFGKVPDLFPQKTDRVSWLALDVDKVALPELISLFADHDLVINAIGKIKQRMRDGVLVDMESAVRANALFPFLLAQAAAQTGTKVVQIATDCVYSGVKGLHLEGDVHDALDLYSRSKSMGEITGDNVAYVRCSMVGPEVGAHFSLLGWFLSQPKGAKIQGYTNHFWNGVTSLHFAKVCEGLLGRAAPVPCVAHLVPADTMSKFELLTAFKEAFGRDDITIAAVEPPEGIDRTLATQCPEINLELWKAAGYASPPSIKDMVSELAAYVKQQK